MGAPSGHGQRNKAHKAGRRAGISARQKQKQGKEGPAANRPSVKAAAGGRVERLQATKQQRDAKRQELLDRKRTVKPPLVVAVLPLSADADVTRLWHGLLAACEAAGHYSSGSMIGGPAQSSDGMDLELAVLSGAAPCMTTVSIGGKGKQRITLLPPPTARSDPLAVVDLARSAEVVLLLVAGGEGQKQVDSDGEMAMAVLRAMGMPTLAVAVQAGSSGSGSVGVSEGSVNGSVSGRSQSGGAAGTVAMKERSAARKRAEKALAAQAPGEHKLFHADSSTDMQQVTRHLAEVTPAIPLWRQQRPSLMVEDVSFQPSTATQEQSADASAQQQAAGTLLLHAFVRCAGLSANSLITIPGAGDFQISEIWGPSDPHLTQSVASTSTPAGADVSMGEVDGASDHHARLLAKADDGREGLVRENEPDPLEGEQTWPSAQELLDAESLNPKSKRRRLPAGTSDYQAAWILDEDGEIDDALEVDEADEEADDGKSGPGAKGASKSAAAHSNGGSRVGSSGQADDHDDDMPELELMSEDDGTGTHGMDTDGGHDEDEDDKAATAAALAHQKQKAEAVERDFPDEVDTPLDTPARVRFQKFRGLKSFRSSPWDPKESLPPEYGRVFAFENFKRAHKRAAEAVRAATEGLDPAGIMPGTWVVVHVENVPAAAAAGVIQRVHACASGSAPPLVATGLMAHEGRMSVVNFAVKKAAGYTPVLANKEELLLVTGVRSFLSSPILSTDNHGADKHKLERFLQPGAHAIATCYAPISYGPLPLLAFKLQPGGRPAVLAASGSLRSCDPDRVVLKKVVLTGYPVRVHKKRATVRFMFHHAEDIRWFQPVELFTKTGRRGRIAEPLGTHGGMKCLFDGPVQQFDSVAMALYKRSFPRWPADTSAAAFA